MTSTEASSFDPKDPQYQVDPEFPPDKEETWPYPKEKDGWILEHNSLRAEVTDMKDALGAVMKRGGEPPAWAIDTIQKWWEVHQTHVHQHHTHEDEIFSPFIRTRAKVTEKTEADHKELIQNLDALDTLVKSMKTEDGMGKVEELAKQWNAYEEMLFPHLIQEEEETLPLMRAYFTAKEVAPLVQKVVSLGEAETMGAFVHYNGGEFFFRKQFMKQEGIPGFVWHVDIKKKYKLFVATQVVRIDALKSGEEPPPIKAKQLGKCVIL